MTRARMGRDGGGGYGEGRGDGRERGSSSDSRRRWVGLAFVAGTGIGDAPPQGDHATWRTVRVWTPSSSATVARRPAAREGAHSRTVLSSCVAAFGPAAPRHITAIGVTGEVASG